MPHERSRRDFLKLAGIGGVVLASRLAGAAPSRNKSAPLRDFFFLQLSDTHWGFAGPPNPDAAGTLPKAIATINSVARKPDFVVFTGDLTHTTDDGALRRKRLGEFKQLIAGLDVPVLKLMPGEHDAALDEGRAYQEFFGATRYAFDHKGVHFVVLDNVSDPAATVGESQLDWLATDLKRLPRDAPIVVFAHRPLFDLYPQWDWSTRDGARVIDVLLPYKNVTVFYGHIHQEHHHETEHIAHHAARSLVFALPAPGSAPKRAPVAWDPAAPYRGLGYRSVDVAGGGYRLAELPVKP